MVYVQQSDAITKLLRDAGIQVCSHPKEAKVMIHVLPANVNERAHCQRLFVLEGLIDFELLTRARAEAEVLRTDELVRRLTTLLYDENINKQQQSAMMVKFETNCTAQFNDPGDCNLILNDDENKTPTEWGYDDSQSVRRMSALTPVEHRKAFVISSFSTKGGVGKTSIALNVAAYYATHGKKTVLVDMDLGTGDYPELLGISINGPTVENWRDYARHLSASLPKHVSTGMAVLPGGKELLEMTTAETEDLIEILKVQFDAVVLDYGVKPNYPHTKTGLSMSDKILTIVEPKRGMMTTLLEQFWHQHPDWVRDGKLVLVINMIRHDSHFNGKELSKIAGVDKYFEIPEDDAFETAKSKHKAVIEMKGSAAGQAISELSRDLCTVGPVASPKSGFLNWIWR